MASSSEDVMGVLKFRKLNGSNYRSWAFNMRLYLESLDLFEHADGSAETPTSTGNDAAALLRAFNSRAKKAWTSICLAVEPEQQIHVRETTTAKEAWDALKSQFARESILQKIRLRQQYYSCRFQSGNSMLEHITHLRSLHDQLKEMGVSVDDKELAMTLLASLPEEFKPLITALDAVGEDQLSFEKVKGMLLNDVDRSFDGTFGTRKSEDAFSARRSMGYSRRGRQGRGSSGPVSHEVKFDKPFRGTCHYCKEKGHFARDCPKKNHKENAQRGNGKSSANCAEKNDSDPVIYVEAICEEALITSDEMDNSGWIIDSGATQHMSFERDSLSDYIEFRQPCTVNLGDNGSILAYGKGTYHLLADLDENSQPIALHDVLYLPDLKKNLLSVRAMTKLEASVEFKGNQCRISRNGKLLAVGEMQGKLYMLKIVSDEHINIAKDEIDIHLWHNRFGHLGMDNVEKLMKDKMVEGMKCSTKVGRKSVCEPCIMGKQHRVPYSKGSATRATRPFEVVHSDVCGPMSVDSLGGSKYFITFIDDYSRYTHVYFIKHKHEVMDKFKEFVNFTTNVTGKQMKTLVTENLVKTLRSDNGGEYCSKKFDAYMKEKGIVHQTTVPYSPAQNGVAERMNRTLVETALSMMSQSGMPKKFWAEAVNTATYLRNRSPTTSLDGVTPFESLFNRKPDVSNLKVFGCLAYAHIPKDQRKKFEEKSRKSVFVGYPNETKGYKLYDLKACCFIRSRDVIFAENDFHDFENGHSVNSDLQFFYPVDNDSQTVLPNVSDVVAVTDEPHSDQAEPEIVEEPAVLDNEPVGVTYEDNFMREVNNLPAQRQRRPPVRFIEEEFYAAETLTADINEPSDIFEAWRGDYSTNWKDATNSEYDSLLSNHTWDLVPLPEGKNVVGSRWVFKVKRNADGLIEKFKARLVAQGYSQSHGLDYQEVFSPVVRYSSIRSLLVMANIYDWECHQMDVKTAFLQGDLDEEIYMKQPDGYINKKKPNHVCKLNKSIYGLKQAARCWNHAIDSFLKSEGYKNSSADSCLYIKSVKQRNGKVDFIILALYVDDILLFSNNIDLLMEEKISLGKRFKVEDLGEVHYVLGMSVKRDRKSRTLSISQPKYLEGILKRSNMDKCKPVSTPLEQGRKFQQLSEDEKPVNVQGYQMIIGCLTYATTATRPDLAAAVGILSKFMAKPGKDHWTGIKRILRYVQGTLNYGLVYSATDKSHVLVGYSDADWAGDLDTRRSTSGYVFQIQGNTVSWCSKRQASVSKSSTEAEYIALSGASQEGIWIRRLLADINLEQKGPTIILEDNQGAIELAKNPKFHNRTKHIDVAYHFIREQVHLKAISVEYCPTKHMLADIMTKGLGKIAFENFRDSLGIKKIN